jgi:hypothetical protein
VDVPEWFDIMKMASAAGGDMPLLAEQGHVKWSECEGKNTETLVRIDPAKWSEYEGKITDTLVRIDRARWSEYEGKNTDTLERVSILTNYHSRTFTFTNCHETGIIYPFLPQRSGIYKPRLSPPRRGAAPVRGGVYWRDR